MGYCCRMGREPPPNFFPRKKEDLTCVRHSFGNINIPSSQATLHSALPPFKRDSFFKFLILKRLAKYKN
jgi:hypothetical protein